jgi:hypothetical protein
MKVFLQGLNGNIIVLNMFGSTPASYIIIASRLDAINKTCMWHHYLSLECSYLNAVEVKFI